MATEDGNVPVHEGGCLCGALRYKVIGAPLGVAICHCTNCQLNSGSAFSVNATFPAGTMTLEGTPSVYDDVGDTGNVVRRIFCGTCGTPIESQSVYSVPNYVVIKAGTFDKPADFVPDCEVYCDSKLPWVRLGIEVSQHDKTNFDSIKSMAETLGGTNR
jgi:hypothetical protein